MPKVFTSKSQQIGEIGENVAVKFLVKLGFVIIERNYTKKWGEIDIVTEKDKKIHFIEVKSVQRDMSVFPFIGQGSNDYRAEDNMHPWKLKRLSRTIQTYLISRKIPEDMEWQLDLLVVYLDLKNKKAKVKVENDIVL